MSELSLQSINELMKYLIVDELRINSSDVTSEGGLDWEVSHRLYLLICK